MKFKEFHAKENSIALSLTKETMKLERIDVVVKTATDVEYEIEHFEYNPKDLKLVIRAKRRTPVETM